MAENEPAGAPGPHGLQFGDHNTQENYFGDVVIHQFDPRLTETRTDSAPAALPGTVRRDDLIDATTTALCASTGPQTVALTGAGGIGKTTVAGLVCREKQVRAHYPGDLVWITIGLDRTGTALADTVNQAAYTVSGRQAAMVDPVQAVQHLAQALRPGSLVVVDDVWTAEQWAPFQFLGSHGCLVTTRNTNSLPAGTTAIPVNEMSGAEATAMLTGGPAQLSEDDLDELFDITGRWPLLLAIVNGFLTRFATAGRDPAAMLKSVRRRMRSGERPIAAVLQTSMSFLAGEYGDATLDRYIELVIFPSQDPVPLDVVADLWHETGRLSPGESEDICVLLSELSLVEELNFAPPRVRVHDVVRDHLGQVAGDERIRQVTTRMLGTIDAAAPWRSLGRVEGYLWHHLRHLFHGAGRAAEWARLVVRPEWVAGKLEAVGAVALYADLDDPEVPAAGPLLRAVGQSGHLLVDQRMPGALTATLLSRMPRDEELGGFTAGLQATVRGALLSPALPLPDRPKPSLRTVLRATTAGAVRVLRTGTASNELTGLAETLVGGVLVWDVATGRRIVAIDEGLQDRGLEVPGSRDPGCPWLVTSTDTQIEIWDLNRHRPHYHLPITGGEPSVCAVPGHLGWMLIGDGNGLLKVVEFGEAVEVRAEDASSTTAVVDASVDRTGTVAAVLRKDGSITTWTDATKTFRTIPAPVGIKTQAGRIAVRGELAVVSTGDPHGVLLCDLRGGEWTGSLTEPALDYGTMLPVSADGRLVVTGDADRDLQYLNIWDISLFRRPVRLHRFALHDDQITACEFSPDGRILGVGYQGGEAFVAEVDDPTRAVALTGHEWPVVQICFGPDLSWLATAEFMDGPVRVHTNEAADGPLPVTEHIGLTSGKPMPAAHGVWLWNPATWDFARRNAGRNHEVHTCAAGRRLPWLVTYGTAHVTWDTRTGAAIRLSPGLATREDSGPAYFEGERGAPMAAEGVEEPDGTIYTEVWDPVTGETLFHLPTCHKKVVAVGHGAGLAWLVTAVDEWAKTLAVWDMADTRRMYTLDGCTTASKDNQPALDGTALALLRPDGSIAILDVASGVFQHEIPDFSGESFTSLVVAGDGKIAYASAGGTVMELDLTTGGITGTRGSGMTSVSVLFGEPRDHTALVKGTDTDGKLCVVRMGMLGGPVIKTGLPPEHHTIAVSADGRWLCTFSRGRDDPFTEVAVHDSHTGALVAELHLEGKVSGCAWIGELPLISLVGDRGVYVLRLEPPGPHGALPEPPPAKATANLLTQHALVASSRYLPDKAASYAKLAHHLAERSGTRHDEGRALYALGICYERAEHRTQAVEAFQSCVTVADRDLAVAAHSGIARVSTATGDHLTALHHARAAARTAGTGSLSGITARLLAKICLDNDHAAEATRVLRDAAESALAHRRFDEIVHCLRMLADTELPDYLSLRSGEAEILAEAYRFLHDRIGEKEAVLRLAETRTRDGNISDAALAYLTAIRIPEKPAAGGLDELLTIARTYPATLDDHFRHHGTTADLADLADLACLNLLADGHTDQVRVLVDRRSTGSSRSSTVRLHQRLAWALRNAGLVDEAESILLGAVATAQRMGLPAPVVAGLYNELAITYGDLGQPIHAAHTFERAADALRSEGYNIIGLYLTEAAREYQKVQDWQSSRSLLGEATAQLRPLTLLRGDGTDFWKEVHGDALLLFARANAELGDLRTADKAYDDAAAIVSDPRFQRLHPAVFETAARLQELAGNRAGALAAYQGWLASGLPGHEAWIRWRIASLQFEAGRWEQAAVEAWAAAGSYRRERDAHNERFTCELAGRAYKRAGRYNDAVAAYQRCYDLLSTGTHDPDEIRAAARRLAKARRRADGPPKT